MQSTQEQVLPFGCFVVAKLEKDDADSLRALTGRDPGLIELPVKIQGKVAIAHILEVGPGAVNHEGKTIPLDVKKGDKVILMKAGLMPLDPIDDTICLALASNCVAKIVGA